MPISIGEIAVALTTIDKLSSKIEEAWKTVRTHFEEVEDENKRAAILEAIDRRDVDFIRSHLFT